MPIRYRPDMLTLRLLAVVAASCMLLCAAVRADVVQTTDGRRIEGAARFVDGALAIATKYGTIRLPLREIDLLRRDLRDAVSSGDSTGVIPTGGLMAEYFADMEMNELRSVGFARARTAYGFNWQRTAPDLHNELTFAARLTGWLTIPKTGTYRFVGKEILLAQIDGQPIADEQGKPIPFELQAGQRVAVRIEKQHKKPGQHAYALLRWSINDGALQIIPPQCFSPAEELAERMVAFHNQRLSGVTFGGLKAEYFSDIDMTELKLTRLDSVVNQLWRTSTLIHPDFTEGFTARWTGKLKAAKTGTANFQVTPRTRLWIDGKKIADHWPTTKDKTQKGQLRLEAGRLYDIRIEYTVDHSNMDRVVVWWNQERSPQSEISTRWLYPPDDIPQIEMVLPLPGARINATDGMTILVAARPGKGDIRKVEIVDRNFTRVHGESTQPPFHVTLRPEHAGAMTLRARLTDAAGQTAVTEPVGVVITAVRSAGVPAPWSVGRVGSADAPVVRFSGDRIELTGNRGVFGEKGELPLLSRMLGPDEQLTARLESLSHENPNTPAMAGVVLRTGFEANDPHVTLLTSPAGGWFLSKPPGDGDGVYLSKPIRLPAWLRVARQGPQAAAYWSENGDDWHFAGSITLGETDDLIAGLTAIALNQPESVTAVFESVSVAPVPIHFAPRQRGVQLTNGSIVYGEVKIGSEAIVVTAPGGGQFTFELSRVARIIYMPVRTHLLDSLPEGWRGALVEGDLLEGDVVKLTHDRVSVSSLIFGVREVRDSQGLAVAVLGDVQRDPQAVGVHHDGGCAVVTDLRIDGDRLVLDDPAVGRLELGIDQVLAISR